MTNSKIEFSDNARAKILKGVDILANAVKVTLGAKGRNVIIEGEYYLPHVTKDGVTVAKSIFLSDKFENMGAQLVKSVAAKTADEAGDGTTTATILTQAILKEGNRNIIAGAHPMQLKKGIDLAVKMVVDELKDISLPIGEDLWEIERVATISGNNDPEVGQLIRSVIEVVGGEGVVTVHAGKSSETTFDIKEGMQFNNGYISPFFATNAETLVCEYENPFLLLVGKKILNFTDLLPVLNHCVREGRPLLIIAEDIVGDAINALVQNKVQGGLRVVAVKSPYYGSRRDQGMFDIAALTGATYLNVSGQKRIDEINDLDVSSILGSCEKIIITKDSTIISGGNGKKEDVDLRISQIKNQLKELSGYDKELMQERLAKLTGCVANLEVGGTSEVEMKEKKDRIDDALLAVRAAVSEGVIAGGGAAFVKIANKLRKHSKKLSGDEKTGFILLLNAMIEPAKQILTNAGIDSGAIIRDVERNKKAWFGYNVKTERIEDLYKAGIIDPTKVARVALQNAASVAGTLLTTDCAITFENKKEE